MARLHIEKVLQKELVAELLSRGWVEGIGSKEAGKYDRKRALYTEDVLEWIKTTEPAEYAKVKAMHNGETDEKLLKRLVDVIEQRGTIDVLRNGFDYLNSHFPMCAFKPNSNLNPSEWTRYGKVILRVVQELEYSDNNENRLDLGFFVNGIPVATSEMKTENTQTIDDAVRQYCNDRPPKDSKTKKDEPLLQWRRGAIVHFAISSREVQMTTKLAGPNTHFLPFNRGHNGGKGNPPGTGVNYMWEEILGREPWLDILGNFVCIERKKKVVGDKIIRKETLLFPRYHQWRAVTRLANAAYQERAGHRYLIQHSAGSGKSNSIMWLGHRLAHLHGNDDKRIFDTVFVLTDRTVLDEQLADAVKQFDNTAGVIARIDGEGESKSEQLKRALAEGKPIVIVTLQTFPYVLDTIQGAKEWQGRNFAIIADEAHSSQSGATAQKIREVLGLEEEDGDIGVDDELAARMEITANPKNLSYFAFTATPKAKTIEIFGRKNAEGNPEPFDVYTMRQAIEEGFILDVLENYTTYEAAYKVATSKGENVVPKGEAAKLIARMQKLHPYAIAQKVAIIVEHFRETVAPKLSGHAKAMVVTDSREAAVRYKKHMDAYIAEKGYTDLKTLVAFSGDVPIETDFPGTYKESTMNPDLKGMDIPEAFETDEYQVLIVAEKYQTGFDQPLLCGMYVDKKLEGLAAVQTLSRLNRTYHGDFGVKESTYVLDFVNDAERIRDAFLPYYETAAIDEPTDPNKVHDLAHTIDAYGMPGLYTEPDIEAFAEELFEQAKSGQPKQTKLNNLIAPIADRFLERLGDARLNKDSQGIEEAEIFRKNLKTFVRAYRFLSQIYNFGNLGIAKREAFYEWLSRGIRVKESGERPDITSVDLTHFGLNQTFAGKINLDGGKVPLKGSGNIGTAAARVKEYAPLSEVVRLMNEFFGTNIKEENQITMIAGVFSKGAHDADLAAQARNNTKEKFTLGDVKDRIKHWMTETYLEAIDEHAENTRQMTDIKMLLSEQDKFDAFAQVMGSALYEHLAKPNADSIAPTV